MGNRPRIQNSSKPNNTKQPQSNKVQALTDIEVTCDEEVLFSCKQNDIIPFIDVVYEKDGTGYFLFDGDIKIQLIAFKKL